MNTFPLLPQRFSVAILALVVPWLSAVPDPVLAQQEPVAVMAVAGLDRLLDDVNFVFEAGEAIQHAQMIEGVIANFNDLRGLDRQRPIGLYLFFPVGGDEPEPLLFFPFSDVDDLLTSIRIGNALRLERGGSPDRLVLHTEDGELPGLMAHGFVFIDPTKKSNRLRQALPDPMVLLGDALKEQDAALIVRREGIPPFLFEVAAGQIRTAAIQQQPQRPGESDEEYAIRSGLEEAIFSLAESVIQEWQGARVTLNVADESGRTGVTATIELDPSGRTVGFLSQLVAKKSRFRALHAEPAALSLAMNWQPTPYGRQLLETVAREIRTQVERELAESDTDSRTAVISLIDAFESTLKTEDFNGLAQLVGAPPNGFILIGALRVAGADQVAASIEQLLPLAAESKDIRQVEMSVARAGDVAIHRMWPTKLRKRDRRLYGDDAAIYLAVGSDAFWMGIGGEPTIDLLSESIPVTDPAVSQVLARPRQGRLPRQEPSQDALLDLKIHASDWVGFARTDGGGRDAVIARLARQAFSDPSEDTFRLTLAPTAQGLQLQAEFGPAYVRFIGLMLSEHLSRR